MSYLRKDILFWLMTFLLSASWTFCIAEAQVLAGAGKERGVLSSSPTTWPLIQESDISYSGAFRMPNEESPSHGRRLGYGGNALGYNSLNQSLFVGGHAWYQLLCEVSIPTPSKDAEYDSLPLATLLQECVDVSEGTLSSVARDSRLGGSLVYNNRLINTVWSYYDASCSQSVSHGASTSINLSTSGNFSSFFRMDAVARPREVGGYMTVIPQAWQSLFGGPALSGLGGTPIISCASSGLAATVFNPDDVGVKNPIPGTTLLRYPSPEEGIAKELFHWLKSTATRGIAFPEGSRSVLFVGVQGETACYGTGEACSDPCSGSKGVHSYPYHIKVWAYDANELLKVKSGELSPSDVRPYGIWTLSEMESGGCAGIRGAAFDPSSGRLFIAPNYGEKPIIHVYQVSSKADTVAPAVPANLRVH